MHRSNFGAGLFTKALGRELTSNGWAGPLRGGIMSRRRVSAFVAVSMVAATATARLWAADEPQNTWPGEQGQSWASVAKLPDWRGAWGLDAESFRRGVQIATSPDPNNPYHPPLTPAFEAKRLANGAANGGHGPATGTINNSANCIPNGMPGLMQAPFAFEFVMAPGMVYVLPENNSVRRIYTDGRAHPDDPDPSFNGHSIGHWEGSVLVVDTVGISKRAEYFMGLKTSGHAHVIERMFKRDAKTFQIDTTVDDPVAFTKPFVYTKTYQLSSHGMMEYVCAENNRDNNGTLDLTPPE
jgi:hypothetical protein